MPPGFFESQIYINLFLQSLGPWLTPFMQAFTYLGQEDFFILLIVIIFWLYDRRLGLRLGVLLLISNGLNSILKLAFHDPRPFLIDTRVKAMANEPSFGLPSGHTQNGTATWGGWLLPKKRWWAYALYGVIVVLIAISRFYLGMHFLVDAVIGFFFGLLTVVIYLAFEKRIAAWISKRSLKQLIWLSVLCSLVFLLIFWIVTASLGGWVVPAEWKANALTGYPEEAIDPLSIRNLIKSSGTILGLLAGAAWIDRKYPAYSIRGTRSQKIMRLALGIAGVLVIYAGLGLVIPRESTLVPLVLTYIRFALVGFWVSVWAPLLFMKARLVEMDTPNQVSS
jgi:membrane-associated phospholipid phosphatase